MSKFTKCKLQFIYIGKHILLTGNKSNDSYGCWGGGFCSSLLGILKAINDHKYTVKTQLLTVINLCSFLEFFFAVSECSWKIVIDTYYLKNKWEKSTERAGLYHTVWFSKVYCKVNSVLFTVLSLSTLFTFLSFVFTIMCGILLYTCILPVKFFNKHSLNTYCVQHDDDMLLWFTSQ